MAAETIRVACLHKVRRAATWVLQQTELGDAVADEVETDVVIDLTEELDLDRRFDTYLDLTMEEDPSRAWFTA